MDEEVWNTGFGVETVMYEGGVGYAVLCEAGPEGCLMQINVSVVSEMSERLEMIAHIILGLNLVVECR